LREVSDPREEIRAFLQEALNEAGDDEDFVDGDSLVVSGRLNSFTVIEIVMFLETNYDFDFSEGVFDQTDFDSVDRITQLIASRAGEA
jgi:acyl carrier protein